MTATTAGHEDHIGDNPGTDQSGFRRRLGPLLALLRPYRGLTIAAAASGVIYQLSRLLMAGAGAWLVGAAVTGSDRDDLVPGFILLGASIIPYVVAPWLETFLSHLAAYKLLADLRTSVYDAFERLAPAYLLERRSGDLGAVAISDVEQTELFFAHTLSPLVVAITVPVSALIVLAWLDPLLAAVLVPILVALALVPVLFGRVAERQGDAVRTRFGVVSAEVIDALQGVREIVMFGAQSRFREKIAAQERGLRAAAEANVKRSALQSGIIDCLSVAGLLSVLVAAAWLVANGHLRGSLYPVAVVLAATTFAPVVVLSEVARDLNVVAAASTRLRAILDAKPSVTDLVKQSPPCPPQPGIAFQSVRFRYRTELEDVLHDVNFSIEPGTTVALVGQSGAGKSTCAHLLLRLWDVSEGAILVGGNDLRAYRQEDLRRLTTFVPQDVHLFNISLRENIRLARPDASDEEIEHVARVACIHDHIAALPEGYDSIAGELGHQLSGGQRQRIAIARALLKDAPILIFDEAVSSLDAASEMEFNEAMASARRDRTTLIIAHRLSTIRTADRIVVLNGGRIVETGTYAELSLAGTDFSQITGATSNS